MSDYYPPLDDMRFVLEHVVGLESLPEHPDLGKLDIDMVDSVLEPAAKLASEILAPLNRVGDETGAKLDGNVVTMPEGFKAGELNWPLPRAFTREGDINDYGYENEVLLWSDIKVPPGFDFKTPIPVKVITKWISCEEICIPGKAQFSRDLTANGNKNLFDTWKKRIPSQKNNKFDIKVENEDNKYNIIINNSNLENTFKLYPIPLKTVDIEDISYSNQQNKKIISFSVKIYPGHKSSSENLDTVITYTDKDSNRKGFEYKISLKDWIIQNSG